MEAGKRLCKFKSQHFIDDPFQPSAFEEVIQGIAKLAKETNTPKYCAFDGSNFRIHPDGTVEWSHRMPTLRDNIAEIIENSLRNWRENLRCSGESQS